jgi:hypothetical protein
MPALQKKFVVVVDDVLNLFELSARKAVIDGEFERVYPKLRFFAAFCYVNMGTLQAISPKLIAEKAKDVSNDSRNDWHL